MARASKLIPLAAVLLLALSALPIPTVHVAQAFVPPSEVWVAPPPTGSDSNPGTEAEPFATIQNGIDSVAQDGTVHVATGTYLENLSIDYGQDLVGAGAQNTIIDADGSGRVLDISSGPWQNTISGFTIKGGNLPNGPGSYGGGIYINSSHDVTINECTITNNQAQWGGGISNWGILHINSCTFSGNSAGSFGGGIHNHGMMWLNNSTISGNSINEDDGGGGGIWNGGDMMLVNCTIAYNAAGSSTGVGGGFLYAYSGFVSFKNTIVANNTAGTSSYNNGYIMYPPLTSQGYNLCGDNSCGFDQPTDLVNTDPLLGPLQDNGGPTFTHALLHGSPAIDAGSCNGFAKSDHVLAAVVPAPGTDQRGIPRPQGANCDIGAYELAQSSVNTSTGTGTAYFSSLNGYITNLSALSEAELDCPPMPNLDFPHGLFSFNVTNITPGSSVTIVIILPSNVPPGTQYWKCINGHWVNCTSLLGSNDGDNVLTLTITDGGLGDGDGQANGQISDPGGPTVPAPSTAASGVSPTIQRPLNPPKMSVQYVSVNPQQAYANQSVTITTNVVNTGDEAGNLNVALKINGMVEQSRMVSVGPQGTQPVKFTVTKAQPGTYTVDILGEQGSFTVLGNGGTTSAPLNGGLIAIIIMGVLVLATVLVLLLSRKTA